MAESPRRTAIDIPSATILKLLAVAIFIWVWLQVWQLFMLILVVAVLAVAFDPIVGWLERHRIPRGLASLSIALGLLAVIVGFGLAAGSSLASEARLLGDRISELQQEILRRTPAALLALVPNGGGSGEGGLGSLRVILQDIGRTLVEGVIVLVVAVILTFYLLVEGRQTYAWLLAYVPKTKRMRVHVTACEARRAILGYVAGNVATSVFATAFVWISLAILHVPAAMLLALLAGVCDFVPVLGFVLSAAPAVLLALTRSPATAIAVIVLYGLYHFVENYFIAPKVYGDRLQLSNLAVLFAFAVGAAIGGVVGALLALPAAAMYPVIERLWLKEYLGREVIEQHRIIEHRAV
jgi:predicted PurR-regulated permease PerM